MKIKFHCNFCSDEQIYNFIAYNWGTNKNPYLKEENYKDIYLTKDDDYDIFAIVNFPKHNNYDKNKTIVFQAEPLPQRKKYFFSNSIAKNFININTEEFLFVYETSQFHNIIFPNTHIDIEFSKEDLKLKQDRLVAIISRKNDFEGHKDRINFIDNHLQFYDKFDYYVTKKEIYENTKHIYKELRYDENDGMANIYKRYKYVYQSENCYEKNYFTEKIFDSINNLCFTFYNGCPNVENFINKNVFLKIDNSKYDKNNEYINIIDEYIKSNTWESILTELKKERNKLKYDHNLLRIVRRILKLKNLI